MIKFKYKKLEVDEDHARKQLESKIDPTYSTKPTLPLGVHFICEQTPGVRVLATNSLRAPQ